MQKPHEQLGGVPTNFDAWIAIARALRIISEHINKEARSLKDQFPKISHTSAKNYVLMKLGFDPYSNAFEKYAARLVSQTERALSSAWFNKCSGQKPRQSTTYRPYYASVGVDWLSAKTVAESSLATMSCRSIYSYMDEWNSTELELGQRQIDSRAASKFLANHIECGDQILVIESESDLERWFSGIGGIGLVSVPLLESQHKLACALQLQDVD
jgi:hypothetical protein